MGLSWQTPGSTNAITRRPVGIFLFQDDASPKTGTSPFSGLYGLPTGLGSNTNIYNNRSLTKLSYKADGEAEYSFTKSEHLMFGYGWDRADRHCSYSWITCADAKQVNENTFRTEWRKSRGALTARLEYAFSERRGDYNENAFLAETPMANHVPAGGASQSLYSYLKSTGLTGFGPVAGLPSAPLTGDAAIFTPNNNTVAQAQYGTRNILNEIPGFRRYYVADRDRNDARAQFLWLAKDKVAIQGSGEGSDDDYLNTKLGLKRRTWWAATIDVSYTASEDLVADVFYTYDNQRLYSHRRCVRLQQHRHIPGAGGRYRPWRSLLRHRRSQERSRQNRSVPELDPQRPRQD